MFCVLGVGWLTMVYSMDTLGRGQPTTQRKIFIDTLHSVSQKVSPNFVVSLERGLGPRLGAKSQLELCHLPLPHAESFHI